ncbi:MAG: CDP-diacylglycerol--glycerol-3-phosphate 3-phosphatidyltransferase [Fusobacteria bacterium]|nr:CDP-diacylglycerol--glycerol-3-phosphate 3-phosphatidyltransferase [Fusobacteriota bacterium]
MKNLPNILTLLRIILVIPFIICFFVPQLLLIALIIFIIASITDFLDGYLARKHNMITNFGKIMDPLADKVLVMAALILFTTTGFFPMWGIIIILFREVYVTIVRIYAAERGNVIAAGNSGKLKTVIQMVTVVILFIFPLGVLAWVFVTLTIILTVYSGCEYMIKNSDFLKSEVKQCT